MEFNSLIPELAVSNIKKSLDFYNRILGFKIAYRRNKPSFAFLSLWKNQLMIEEINKGSFITGKLKKPFGRGMHLQIQVEKIDVILERLKKDKYPMFVGLHEKWYRKNMYLLGNRQFIIKDPDGYLLRFFENLGKKKA